MSRNLLIVSIGLIMVSFLVFADQASKTAITVERGRVVYQYWCATCHGSGPQMPGTDALAAKYKGQGIPAVLEARRDLTAQQIEQLTRHGINMMPFFRKTEVSDQDLADMIAYLTRKSLR
jgi:(+)-pinoresinol hydroxylase